VQIASCFEIARTIEIGNQILGISWAGTRLYLSLWLGKDRGGAEFERVS